jgi:hypothetical protein
MYPTGQNGFGTAGWPKSRRTPDHPIHRSAIEGHVVRGRAALRQDILFRRSRKSYWQTLTVRSTQKSLRRWSGAWWELWQPDRLERWLVPSQEPLPVRNLRNRPPEKPTDGRSNRRRGRGLARFRWRSSSHLCRIPERRRLRRRFCRSSCFGDASGLRTGLILRIAFTSCRYALSIVGGFVAGVVSFCRALRRLNCCRKSSSNYWDIRAHREPGLRNSRGCEILGTCFPARPGRLESQPAAKIGRPTSKPTRTRLHLASITRSRSRAAPQYPRSR